MSFVENLLIRHAVEITALIGDHTESLLDLATSFLESEYGLTLPRDPIGKTMDREAAARLFFAVGKGFFCQNVFTGIEAGDGTFGVEVMRKTLEHHVATGQSIVVIGKDRRVVGEKVGNGLSFCRIDIDDSGDFQTFIEGFEA